MSEMDKYKHYSLLNDKNHLYINTIFPYYNFPMNAYDLDGNEIKKIRINLK